MSGSAGGKVLKLLWPSWDQMRSMHTAFGAGSMVLISICIHGY